MGSHGTGRALVVCGGYLGYNNAVGKEGRKSLKSKKLCFAKVFVLEPTAQPHIHNKCGECIRKEAQKSKWVGRVGRGRGKKKRKKKLGTDVCRWLLRRASGVAHGNE